MTSISLPILSALLIDSFDWIVLLLLIGSFLAWRNTKIKAVVPLLITTVLVLAVRMALPLWAIPRTLSFYALIWIPLILLMLTSYRHIALRQDNGGSRPTLHVSTVSDWCILLLFGGLSAYLLTQWDQLDSQDWFQINRASFLIFLFYSIYQIAPWQRLPKPARREMGVLLFTLAMGIFGLRAGVWVYTAFGAAYQNPFISFQLNGPVISRQFAQQWNFTRLEKWILENHYDLRKTLADETLLTGRQIQLLTQGIIEAESFRRSLLVPIEDGSTPADLLALAILRFQDLMRQRLEPRTSLDQFSLDRQRLVEKIQGSGQRIYGSLAFESFRGKWYGKWDQMLVDHHWDGVKVFDPPIRIKSDSAICLRSIQYAWVGDGFGWNAVVSPECRRDEDVILGTVYHVQEGDPAKITRRRPHVGIDLEEGQLIWITREEVFLEEIVTDESTTEEKYAITGFRYQISEGTLANRGDAFQAVYTRNPNDRPPWIQIPIQLLIEG